MVLEILTYPDPFLRKKAKQIENIDDSIQKIIEDMADTMYEAPGVGLAATQAGFDIQLIIYDPQPDPVVRNYNVLINPKIVEASGSAVSKNEGCLSVPGYRTDVKRYASIIVRGKDRNGNDVEIDADGMLGFILQHEIDHLNGILFIDRISSLKRQLYLKKLKKMQKAR